MRNDDNSAPNPAIQRRCIEDVWKAHPPTLPVRRAGGIFNRSLSRVLDVEKGVAFKQMKQYISACHAVGWGIFSVNPPRGFLFVAYLHVACCSRTHLTVRSFSPEVTRTLKGSAKAMASTCPP